MKPLSQQTLVIFHSYKTSFALWNEIGILQRELYLYRELKKSFKEIIFVSYASDSGAEEELAKGDFKVLANTKRLSPMLYALTAWWRHRAILKNTDVFRINQMSAFLAAGPAKLAFQNVSLVVRCGFIWSQFQKHNNALKKIIVRLIEWIGFTMANKIVATSLTDKDDMMKRFGVSPSRITVIRNLIDIDVFKPNNATRPHNKLCTVGRLNAQKNYESLIPALKDSPYEFNIFGQGELKQMVEDLAQKNNVKVVFRGVVPNTQLAGELDRCFAFVLASHYESSPKALLEAMSVGLPVIASSIEHHKDIITDGKNGLLSERTPQSLRAAIDKVMTNPELAKQLGEGARAWILENCSMSAVLKKEIALYES